MINEKALKAYLLKKFSDVIQVDIRKLGSGVQGSGFLIEMKTPAGIKSYVAKTLLSEGLGHDYPSDRASVFLLDLDEYKNLPRHVKAVDVLSEMEDGSIKSIGGGKEYYLLMEKGEGRHYFNDLTEFSYKDRLEISDIEKIKAMTSYLAEIHSVKKDSKTLYWRKLRDTVGHGECLMGVFDTYPDGTLSYDEITAIIKKSVDWIYKLKPRYKRLSEIHGDFHPGNIWFAPPSPPLGKGGDGGVDFILLDRSRGPWGEPADDVTALTINYIFFSIKNHGDVRGAYLEGLNLFFDEYIKASGDTEINEVVAPFFAFRGAVVANPVFYPEITSEQRKLIFRFVNNVLKTDEFEFKRINDYL
jgi:aminoglycoside phosphotransferase (APT) family kinase protein